MTIAKIGKKFPWKTLLLIILVGILVVCLIGILWLGADAFMALIAGGFIAVITFIGGIAWACITSIMFWAGFGVMGLVLIIYIYRTKYAKHKVLIPSTTAAGTGYDTLSKPLFDDDTKVESA